MITFLIGFILFFVNPTAGVVALAALAMHGSYFLTYVIVWAVEIVLYLAYVLAGIGLLLFHGPKFARKF